jgi:hypothetical protein
MTQITKNKIENRGKNWRKPFLVYIDERENDPLGFIWMLKECEKLLRRMKL